MKKLCLVLAFKMTFLTQAIFSQQRVQDLMWQVSVSSLNNEKLAVQTWKN